MATASSPGNEIRRRWSAPAEIVYAKNATNMVEWDGRELRGGVELGLSPDTIQRIRAGRMCANCLEPFETPWPAACPVCRLRTSEQEKLADRTYQGDAVEGQDWGASVNLNDEVDRLDGELERDNWVEHPTVGIVVPRGT